ncbi:long-chain-acyl-CoA synthetase [Rhodococcus hoagii]|uniref:Long-chain-acyl-CoA synthetase n=2 Tax=Rhodococcus hoagii TaxID=43767 RepID=A0AAE2W3F2_RHOHA|nr:long-chain-acyl-CoA synthetase [Prescottella equi]CBH47517.1 putative acyl-CoA ligase/synthetase [Prescottella equi 103S]MBM4478745.1 long-chain-acyl-CoA synthetase [Prescottella equi]MBM4482065.1 long-chain-acyl-CoA synthetase [Prescottella equi]MBM4510688.1 long-chain-acyl-CoA synthetase [Prescottella equi]
MPMSSDAAASTIGLVQLALQLPRMATEIPSLARGALGLTRKPDARESIGRVFQDLARRQPDRPFIRFDGASISYRQANERVNRYADVLVQQGVERGDVVGILMKNRPETLLLTLAAVKLGAVAGMLNHNQRGEVLAHSLSLLDSRVLVVGEECDEAISSLSGAPDADTVLSAGKLDELAESADPSNPAVCEQIQAKERAFYIFTSGTTGMPKASLMSHFRWLKSMSGLGAMGVRLRRNDTLYCALPLYHNNALTVSLSSVLSSGATFAIARTFSASRFWDDAKRNGATAFVYIGEVCRYLLNQPERPSDRDNGIRLMVGNGLRPEIWTEFTERFGIDRVAEFYGASECNIAFVNALGVERTAGVCPLPHAVVEYDQDTGRARRAQDGRLRRVRVGEVGLLLSKVTDRAPFDGYTDPEATESKLVRDAFKDGDCWFDTGDLVRDQGFMHVAFVDRLGDTFRWKGENVATTEVEGAMSAHPAIEQSVVYGVAVPGADGKAGMAAVTLRDGHELDGARLAAHLFDRLPSYAVPLFVRVVDSLETTSTFKSRKVELREEAYSSDVERLYVLAGRRDGYRPAYDGYVREVADGTAPGA